MPAGDFLRLFVLIFELFGLCLRFFNCSCASLARFIASSIFCAARSARFWASSTRCRASSASFCASSALRRASSARCLSSSASGFCTVFCTGSGASLILQLKNSGADGGGEIYRQRAFFPGSMRISCCGLRGMRSAHLRARCRAENPRAACSGRPARRVSTR